MATKLGLEDEPVTGGEELPIRQLESARYPWKVAAAPGVAHPPAKRSHRLQKPTKKNVSPRTSWGPQVDEEEAKNPISTIADQLSPKVGANCCGYVPNNRYKGSDGAYEDLYVGTVTQGKYTG